MLDITDTPILSMTKCKEDEEATFIDADVKASLLSETFKMML